MKPTEEQQSIIDTFKTTRVLKVNAVAGSGKTSTLVMLANENPRSSLYVCFNKVIAEEASGKFPEHVACRTTHSLAYAKFGRMLGDKLRYSSGSYRNRASTSSEVALYFKIKDYENCSEPIKARVIASLVRQTVNRFQNSAEGKLGVGHIPHFEIKALSKKDPYLNTKGLVKDILTYAVKLWNARIDPSSDVMCNHDTYLKLWQLSEPILDYDIIYFDEAQDSNPAVLDVIKRQTQCKIAYVGDTYQSIYQFRGAVNAMELIDAPTKYLSKSFRYGDEIARVAKDIISGVIDVKGNSEIKSEIAQVNQDEEFTFIFRTNSRLLECAVDLISAGKDIYLEIDSKDFCKQLMSAKALKEERSKDVKHESVVCFQSWWDLREASNEDAELKRLVNIINDDAVEYYVETLEKLSKKTSAQITLTTAHKSKGKEWSNVMIADDFPYDKDSINPIAKMPQPEINLLYVACTRAINRLDLPYELYEFFGSKQI